MSEKFTLKEDRFFDTEPVVKKYALEIYSGIKNLPIISPHGHVDPNIFTEDKPFPNPTELFIIPDHYVYRMLYSQGYTLEQLGIPALDGTRGETDPRKIWQIFGDNYYLFRGTPSGIWLDHEFCEVFGLDEKLDGENAQKFYDIINEKLQSPEFYPRALFEKFNIEVLTTTDPAFDTLEAHKKIRSSGWKGNIVPCFRPDSVTDLMTRGWKDYIKKLENVCGYEINSFKAFIQALEERRKYFKSFGAVSTDHGVHSPYTNEISYTEADKLFQKALKDIANEEDARIFTAHMMMEMARMSIEDGLVMQLHPGCYRNHNQIIFDKYGPDKGCDIPMQTEYVHNLKPLLNKYGNNPKLKLIVFTLDETSYSRELAPLAGHYPAMKLGPAWWFHDSLQGMTRFRQQVTETAGFYNTVGFNDDTRAFVSIPARHDLARRMDANFLAGLVAKSIISLNDAHKIAYELTNGLVKKGYNL